MDAASKPEKPVGVAMKNLKIDPPSKASSVNLSGTKDASASDSTSCISSGDATSSIKESEVDQEAGVGEQGMCYYGYCYPGLNGSYGEWDAKGYFVGTDGLEIRPTAIQADNGSFIYYMPNFQPGYNPYAQLLPGAMIGFDGQYFDQQLYYASPMSPQSFVSPGLLPQPVAYGPELVPAYSWDPSLHVMDRLQGSTYNGDRASTSPKPNFSTQNRALTPSKSKPTAKPMSETKGSMLTSNVSQTPVIQNQARKPVNKAVAVLPETYLPINKFLYSNQGKSGLLPINLKDNGRSWIGSEKLKTRNKLNGLGDLDMLNEQNRGPRTSGAKAASNSDVDQVRTIGAETNGNSSASISIVNKDDYNLPDFPTKYDQAMFFVIKSYSEDDVHKSIKYNVWASTPNGNKRLDNAFKLAQEKMTEKGSRCPVFLFFSVNASGQFCGVAEMIGPVDFDKNMDFWQQDKWNGFFPVKWHVIKDVPNPQFRHIILENNDNKPVTNSRDTQEVKFPQGTEILNIFKNYASKTSILDDFGFYENRQKVMQDKRCKPPTPNIERLKLKTDEVTQTTKSYDLKSKASSPPPAVLAAVKNEEEPKTVIAPKE